MINNLNTRKLPLVLLSMGLVTLSVPPELLGKPDKKEHSGKGRKSEKHQDAGRDHDDRGHDHDRPRSYDRDRSHYLSRPRTSFTLNLGTGYAGRGYYYGPPDVPYYYERSDVRYYRTRELAPREYWGRSYSSQASVGASVQQALAGRGYYRGPIDGQIGPYSRREIARYQADHGLLPTGSISASLLRSLGLQ